MVCEIVSKLEYGFKRAIEEIVTGIVISALFQGFANTGLIPGYYEVVFHLVNVSSAVALVFAAPFWATSYTIGWLFGLSIMSRSGLIEAWEFVIYLTPLFVLVLRLIRKVRS